MQEPHLPVEKDQTMGSPAGRQTLKRTVIDYLAMFVQLVVQLKDTWLLPMNVPQLPSEKDLTNGSPRLRQTLLRVVIPKTLALCFVLCPCSMSSCSNSSSCDSSYCGLPNCGTCARACPCLDGQVHSSTFFRKASSVLAPSAVKRPATGDLLSSFPVARNKTLVPFGHAPVGSVAHS